MINYFFLPQSYNDDEESINSIEDLNKAIMDGLSYESFYHDNTYYLVNKGGISLNEAIKAKNPQLVFKVIPMLLKRMRTIDCNDANPLDTLENISPNSWKNYCWIGIGDEDLHHIKCYHTCALSRVNLIRDNIKQSEFTSFKEDAFAKIIFSEDVAHSLVHDLSENDFHLTIERIVALNDYALHWNSGSFNLRQIQEIHGLNISDESDSVKQNPKLRDHRRFLISPAIGTKECFLHVKIGNRRMYIFPDDTNFNIYIVYYGSHLPTAKY